MDDFYKVQGYGLIYKSLGRKVNERPIEDITLNIVRHIYPREMIDILKRSGVVANEIHPGIYRFDGKLSIPAQLVISSQLPLGQYEGLRLLAEGVTVNDIITYAERAIASDNERIRENAGTVINVCLAANKNLEGVDTMHDVIFDMFKDLFDRERENARNDGINTARERVAVDMLKDGKPINEIMRYSHLAENVIRNLAASLGVAVS